MDIKRINKGEKRPYLDKNGKIKNPNGQVFGYARVSTQAQRLDRQIAAMLDYGIPENMLFMDKESGKNLNRPAYKKLIRCIRRGDLIVIKSLDRLGRNYDDIIDQWRMITVDIGCGIHVLDMPILNTAGNPDDVMDKFIIDMMLQVLSFVAENERETTIKRQQEGIKRSMKKQRTKIGRPREKIPLDFWEIYLMHREGKYKSTDLWRFCQHVWGLPNRTFYRRIQELNNRFGDISVTDLRNLSMDEEWYDGFAWDIERLDHGIDQYSMYCSYLPEKAKRAKENKKKRLAEMTEEELERELRETILAERRKRFHELFGIRDDRGAYIGWEEAQADDIKKKKKPAKVGSAEAYRNAHSEGSGFEDATVLIDKDPVVPEVTREKESALKPVRTTIIT